jgi:hypothetical protein
MTTKPLLIPRFVKDLNQIAIEGGLTVSVAVGKLVDSEVGSEEGIICTWSGSTQAFGSLLSLPTEVIRRKRDVGQRIIFPRECTQVHPLLYGIVRRYDEEIVLEVSGGRVPESVRLDDDVEIIVYPDEIGYHGRASDLVAKSYCDKSRGPVGADDWLSNDRDFLREDWTARRWATVRCPGPNSQGSNGYYVHWIETESGRADREDIEMYQDSEASVIRRSSAS